MYVTFFWLPLLSLTVLIYKIFEQDLTQIYHSLGISLSVAFFIPFYPFISLVLLNFMPIDVFLKESGYLSIFYSSTVYYFFSVVGLIVFTVNSSHKGLGITGIILSVLLVLGCVLIARSFNGFDPR